MSHSNVRMWVHATFATKYRNAEIGLSIEPIVHQFIRQELIHTGCFVNCINGMPDHVHILFLLNPKKSIAAVMQQVKGGSSHSINQMKLLDHKFAWQNGYAAFSVSENRVKSVYRYIENQKSHHLYKSYFDELKWLDEHNNTSFPQG